MSTSDEFQVLLEIMKHFSCLGKEKCMSNTTHGFEINAATERLNIFSSLV